MGFLQDEDFDDLPSDDGEAFVRLEKLSRDRMLAMDRDRDGDLTYEDMMSYMNEATALAAEFNIPDIIYAADPPNYRSEYARFTRSVEFRRAQIRVQRARREVKSTVSLSGAAREKIQHYIEKLKAEIQSSEIPEKRKQALLDKIADFESELSKKRFNLAAAMVVIALTTAAAHDFVGTLIDVQGVIQSITQVLGAEKIQNEESQRLLPLQEPFKKIPDLRPSTEIADFGNDEEVPF